MAAALSVCLLGAQTTEKDGPAQANGAIGERTPKKAGKKKSGKKAGGAAESEPAPTGWFLGWNNRPRLGYGEHFRMDVRFKTQLDLNRVSDEADDDDDVPTALFQRTRVGIEGTFHRDLEYELDAELTESRNMLRDAFLNYRRIRPLQFQAGQFRIPFGREQNTSSTNLDFVFRARPATLLAPGRDVGMMLHGRVWDRRFHYQAGVFREDGVIPLGQDDFGGGGATWVARVRNKPSSLVKLPRFLGDLEIGVAAALSRLPEGLFSLRGRTTYLETFFDRVHVNGRRTRSGAELEWKRGPFSVQGELIRSRDQRLGQSVRGLDLPDLVAQGWYLQGAWVITGEKKDGGVVPRRPFLQDGGWGAVELAVREEYLGFRSAVRTGPAIVSTRAANIAAASDRAWTFGVNWFATRHVKIQVNAIRERVDEPRPGIGTSRALFWTQVCRIQFAM
jgi:phosphate-selective porin OprO/OprP